MADSASRSLLTPDEFSKPRNVRAGRRTPYQLPLFIFSFCTLLIGCIASSVAVLLTSHENAVSAWSIRPAILLSVLAGIYAMALGGLFTAGVAVTWWRSITNGTTLQRLHAIYAGANPNEFFTAFLAGGHARRVALVAITVFSAKLAAGPALQRSVRPELRSVLGNLDMKIRLATEFPAQWFGTQLLLSGTAVHTSQESFLNKSITTIDACPTNGTCEAMVPGAGLNFDCDSSNTTIDMLNPNSENSTLFKISLVVDYIDDLPILYLETQFLSDVTEGCTATLTKEVCKMIPAVMWYNISITDNIITPYYPTPNSNFSIVSNATYPDDNDSNDPNAPVGPLQGIRYALLDIFDSETKLDRLYDGKATGYVLQRGSSNAPFWGNIFKEKTTGRSQYVRDNCPLLWRSPQAKVLSHIFDFVFRSALQVGQNREGHLRSFKAVYKNKELRYVTDFGWFAASILIMTIGIVAALSLLWGWWQLDRYVTLSPLETGKAFGGPIFAAAGSEQEARAIIERVGHERVASDGDELVWSGSVYATGAGGSLRAKPSTIRREEASPSELEPRPSVHGSLRGRGHRRGTSSVSDASPTQARPSFEHSLGVTTRRPYDDEEEMDIGQYGRPRSRSRGSDTAPLMPMPLNYTPLREMGPKIAPIASADSIRMESPSPTGRPRKGSRSAMDAPGSLRRPLSKIDERGTPTPPPPPGFF